MRTERDRLEQAQNERAGAERKKSQLLETQVGEDKERRMVGRCTSLSCGFPAARRENESVFNMDLWQLLNNAMFTRRSAIYVCEKSYIPKGVSTVLNNILHTMLL